METNEPTVEDIEVEDANIDFGEADDTSIEDTTDYKAEADKWKGIAKRYHTKMEKSNNAPVETKTEEKPVGNLTKTNEPDYAKEAYLEQRGVVHSDDKKTIYDEAERLKMPLTDILSMEHIKSKLSAAKAQRDAMDGTPKGNGRNSGKTQNDVEYWLAKGETPNDLELANKVIDARLKKESNSNKFSEDLYTG